MISEPPEISEYPKVTEHETFGAAPRGCIILLPNNFATADPGEAPRYPPDTPTLRKILRNAGVPLGQFGGAPAAAYVVNRSAAWIAPVFFIPAILLLENPIAVSIALNVASNYITDFLKGLTGPQNVEFNVVVERKGDHACKRIRYRGDPKGIPKLANLIRQIADE